MTSQKNIWVALIAVLIIAVAALTVSLTAVNTPTAGGVTNYDNIFLNKAIGTTTVSQVGCYNGYATSTATPIRFVYTTSGTSTISGAAVGVVAWQYGNCVYNTGL